MPGLCDLAHRPWQTGKVERVTARRPPSWPTDTYTTNQDRTDTVAPWIEYDHKSCRHSALGGTPAQSSDANVKTGNI